MFDLKLNIKDIEKKLEKLNPYRVKVLLEDIGNIVRNSNKKRIKEQKNVDGSPFAPRTKNKKYKKNHKKKMFKKLATNKRLKVLTSGFSVRVGYFGKNARIARIHQYGISNKFNKTPQRDVLGVKDEDKEEIEQLVKNIFS